MLPIVDNIVGWFGTVGVLEALRRRAVEGGSYRVRVSLTRVCLWLISLGIFDKEFATTTAGSTAGLEHLRGSALGFRNLTNYIARSPLKTGGFRPRLHPALVKSRSSWGSAKDTTETGNQ